MTLPVNRLAIYLRKDKHPMAPRWGRAHYFGDPGILWYLGPIVIEWPHRFTRKGWTL